MPAQEGQLLWTPSPERAKSSAVFRFMEWLNAHAGKRFTTYEELWRWSTTETTEYWAALWQYMGVEYDGHIEQVCDTLEMRPHVNWFKGARVNFAEHLLNRAQDVEQAILHVSETQPLAAISGEELARRVRIMATSLRARGVQPGDRVCAIMPVIPETVVAMLATIGIGATWSNAAPEFGPQSIVDRFGQVAPKVLFVTDGYRYGGKDHDRRAVVADVLERLPAVETVVWFPNLDASAQGPSQSVPYGTLLAGPDPGADAFRFERVSADHPVWIVFSSGTSGLPKAIVHSHAGALLGMYTFCHFHMDVQAGDRVFFYTTTGWIMFNFMVSLLMTGATSVLYDGDPMYPGPTRIWELAEETRATEIGASPTYIEMLRTSGIEPGKLFDLSSLKSLCMSGAPCPPGTMAWCYEGIKQDLWVNNCSGGTEIASALVGGTPMLPVYAGEMQGRCLGFAVEAHDASGKALVGEVGELVCLRPWPSMPVCFLNDPDDRRYRETYFEHEPGVWWHGDMLKINERGGCYIYGRADSTLNRRGIRIGTAEIYRVVNSIEGIADSLVLSMNEGGTSDVMTLFVQLEPGNDLTDTLRKAIRSALKTRYSPRHVPDRIEQVPAIPYTLTGKKMEIPVRRILNGVQPEKAASRDAMRDPMALDYFIAKVTK